MSRRLVLLVLLLALASFANAATFVVNNNGDPASGNAANCAAGNNNTCTLRDAVAAAAGGDTIVFNLPAGSTSILMNSVNGGAPLSLANTAGTVSIDGANQSGAGQVVVDGGAATTVFATSANTSTAISNLTIQNGLASVFNPADSASSGGGIYNNGALTLTNVTLSGNIANGEGGAEGGGIYNASGATVTLTNSLLSSNSAITYNSVFGGGIYNASGATVVLLNTTLSGNSAKSRYTNAHGGGIWNAGNLTLTSSLLSGNSTNGSISISCYAGPPADVCSGSGGGIENSGTVTVTNSTLSGNSANGGSSCPPPSTCSGNGGGIENSGNVTLVGSTLSGNSGTGGTGGYGGGIWNAANITAANTTLSGNSATNGGGLYHADTGTIFVAQLTNTTLSGNSASASGSGMYKVGGRVLFTNSIVADGCAGVPSDGGGNLEAHANCGFPSSNVANLNLGALQNNGGPTQTMLPAQGSAAIDAGIDAFCVGAPINGTDPRVDGVDQRGVSRPQGAHCDVGAVEVSQYALTVSVSGSGSVSAGNAPAPVGSGLISGCNILPNAKCSARYHAEPAPVITLTATAPAGQQVSWGGDCAAAGNAATATVTMNQARHCTARFPVVVTNNADPASGNAANCAAASNSTCTLRDAIAAAVGGDTIVFNLPAGVTTITLASSNNPLTLASSGTVSIDGSNQSGADQVAVDGNHITQVFQTYSSSVTHIGNLTIQNGSSNLGGGIHNLGALTLTGCTLSGNVADAGGAIANIGTASITLIGSTLSANTSPRSTGQGLGGGIYSDGGSVVLTNTTLSGNGANNGGDGGGIYNINTSSATLTYSTLSGNTAFAGADIYNGGTVTLIYSIIADAYGCAASSGYSGISDGGYNIDAGTSCGFTAATSKKGTDPKLGPLQNNGGPTLTMLPGSLSPAINAVLCPTTNAPTTDQRGYPRPDPGSVGLTTRCDIGAVEVMPDKIFANGFEP